jgi:hypothetical protein
MLSYPFAVPPVRRMRLARLVPEFFALLVWGVFLWVWLQPGSGSRLGLWESLGLSGQRFAVESSSAWLGASLSRAAAVAADLAGPLLVFAPIAFVATGFSIERRSGTLESILLTSTHHDRIVRGRFLFVSLPWLRLVAYLLPIYALLAAEPLLTMSCTGWSLPWMKLSGGLLLLGNVRGEYIWETAVTSGPSAHTLFLAVMRLLHDLSAMVLSMAVAFHVSLRARTLARAVVWSFALVPPVLLVVVGPELVWMIAALLLPQIFVSVKIYWLTIVAVLAARWALALGLLRRDARNFDAYVLGQLPDAGGAGRRFRGRRTRQSI